MNKLLLTLKKILGYCPLHGWFKYPIRYRMPTSYVEEEDNYTIGCNNCQEECFDYWDGVKADFEGHY